MIDKKCYVCMKCGMTHFTFRKPEKCKECETKFSIEKEIKVIGLE